MTSSLVRTWQARRARTFFLVTVEYPTSSDRSDGASRCSATTNRASEADCPFPEQDAGLVRSGAGADEAAATSDGHLRRGCRLLLMNTHFTRPIFPALSTASIVVGFCNAGLPEPANVQFARNRGLAALDPTLAPASWYKPAESNQSVHSK
jgi:hypothetical protein